MTIDLNHGSGAKPSRDVCQGINDLIDAALARRNEQHGRRAYLGASALGAPCDRQIQLDYIEANGLGAPEPDKPGPHGVTLRIFATGHNFEELVIDWLRAAGLEMRTVRAAANGHSGQIGFNVANGRFRGHCDGVIVGGPAGLMHYPALWECKALGQKSWQEVVKRGVTIARPVYAAQIALYQAYLELADHPALFTALNRDTAELYHELVPFDAELAQRTSDRAVKILQATDAGEMMPRAFKSSDHHVCRMCRWHGFCWE